MVSRSAQGLPCCEENQVPTHTPSAACYSLQDGPCTTPKDARDRARVGLSLFPRAGLPTSATSRYEWVDLSQGLWSQQRISLETLVCF